MKLIKRGYTPFVNYALKVWALGITIMLLLLFAPGIKHSIPDIKAFFFIFAISIYFGFIMSIPALFLYTLLARYIVNIQTNYWGKKALLALFLVCIMAATFMFIDGEKHFWNTLKDTETIMGLVASAIAVFIIKLPKHQPAILP